MASTGQRLTEMLLNLLGYHTHREISKGGVIIIPQEGGGHVKEVSCVFNKYLKIQKVSSTEVRLFVCLVRQLSHFL